MHGLNCEVVQRINNWDGTRPMAVLPAKAGKVMRLMMREDLKGPVALHILRRPLAAAGKEAVTCPGRSLPLVLVTWRLYA